MSDKEVLGLLEDEIKVLGALGRELWEPLQSSVKELNAVNRSALDERNLELVNRARESIGKLVFKFGNMIDLLEYRGNGFTLKNAPFNVRETLEQLEQLLALKAAVSKNELVLHVDALVPNFLSGDSQRLCQTVMNLLEQPFASMEGGGIVLHLDVESKTGKTVQLRMTASESGASTGGDEELTFSSVAQAQNFMLRQYGTDGIALAVAYQNVKEMGGRLWVRRVAGKGTAFHFTAQLELSTAVAVDSVNRSGPLKRLHSLKVLVVDDHSINQKVLKQMLERDGHQVVLASDGFEALRNFKEDIYDLIFMDIAMPAMDGRETARLMREYEVAFQRRTPIVAVSAFSYDQEWEPCRQAGMDAYLQKPITYQRVVETVAQLARAV